MSSNPTVGKRKVKQGCRPQLRLWERMRPLVVFSLVLVFATFAERAKNEAMPLSAAVQHVLDAAFGKFVLAAMAAFALWQLMIVVLETSSGVNEAWLKMLAVCRKALRKIPERRRHFLRRIVFWTAVWWFLSYAVAQFSHAPVITALPQAWAYIQANLPNIVMLFVYTMLGSAFSLLILFAMAGGKVEVYYPDEVKTSFDDVWGQDHVLERVRETVTYLERPDEIEAQGGYVPSGILLWGPPGTGKTLMAEAVAGETGRPFFFIEPGAFTATFMGIGPLKVRLLFRKLRRYSRRYGGVVAFFDEADSLGNRGAGVAQRDLAPGLSFSNTTSGDTPVQPQGPQQSKFVMTGGGGAGMGILQALLTELNGMKKPRKGLARRVRRFLCIGPAEPVSYRILVIMATNMYNTLDPALLRPGRIDRIFRVGYPSKEGRLRTYEGYFKKVANTITTEQIDRLATITPYASGAMIKDLVNESLIFAMRDGRSVVEWHDVMRAKHFKDLGPSQNVEYVDRERHATALHEAGHAVVALKLRKRMLIDIATIEMGTNYLGMVSSVPRDERFSMWRSDMETDICVALAGLLTERMFFDGDSSSGVAGDLSYATARAMEMEGLYGMGSTTANVDVLSQLHLAGVWGNADDKDGARLPMPLRVEHRLRQLTERTQRILEESRGELLRLTHALETHKTLAGDDVEAVVGAYKGPIIDGSLYRAPGVMETLEAYHAAVLQAHRLDLTVELPVPVIEPDAGSYSRSFQHGGNSWEDWNTQDEQVKGPAPRVQLQAPQDSAADTQTVEPPQVPNEDKELGWDDF